MAERFTNGHALVIGVGGDLPDTVYDAKELTGIFRDPEPCAHPAEQVRELVDPDANRKQFICALDELPAVANADSTVVVYFSEHGAHSERADCCFLPPSEYDLRAPSTTAIKDVELTTKLAAIDAGRLLVLLGRCHAGGFDNTKGEIIDLPEASLPPQTSGSPLLAVKGKVRIAACKDAEVSFAGKPYSAFTLGLTKALVGAGAIKQGGFVRVADLALYAREKVPRAGTSSSTPCSTSRRRTTSRSRTTPLVMESRRACGSSVNLCSSPRQARSGFAIDNSVAVRANVQGTGIAIRSGASATVMK